jgi:hypothetical protein
LSERLRDETLPAELAAERALEFVWRFSDDSIRSLLECLGKRELYKRIFEISVSEMGVRGDYATLKAELSPEKRVEMASQLRNVLLEGIQQSINSTPRGPVRQSVEKRFAEVKDEKTPLLVVDFPTRGITQEYNIPSEIGDTVRKYSVLRPSSDSSTEAFFEVGKTLQKHMAMLRLYAAPKFHELVLWLLPPSELRDCVAAIIPAVGR